MAEQPILAEPPLIKERFSTAEQTIALQTRLILGGEALNPAKRDLPKIKSEQFTGIAVETYSKLKNASTNERGKYWREKAGENEPLKNYDQQMTSWVEGVTRYVNNPQVQLRKQILTRLKFDVNWQEFNQAEAKKLYQRYFGAADTASNVTKFVQDVLLSYAENEKINFERLNQDLPEIKKLANIFGKNSGELLETAIHANAKLVTPGKKQELVDQVNETKTVDNSPTLRVNWLNADEERLLKWLTGIESLEKRKAIPPLATILTESKKSLLIDPWKKLPKPPQPTKINDRKEKQVKFKDIETKVITPETWLVTGTTNHPLVVDIVKEDGSKEKTRVIDKERPYHIPAIIYFDEDVSLEQKELIRATLKEVFSQVGLPPEFILESEAPPKLFFTNVTKRNSQWDVDTMGLRMRLDPTQIEKPHHAFVFTNKDLYPGGSKKINFVVGSALPDIGTVISLSRIWNGVADNNLRNDVIKTEIAHEAGHVFGLASERRGKDNLDFETILGSGAHCKNPGCCMKQGNRVPLDFIKITQDRIKYLDQNFYCHNCQQDLQEKFSQITVPESETIHVTEANLEKIEEESPLIQIQEELREEKEKGEMTDEEILAQINIEEPTLEISVEDMIAADPQARAETLTYESNKTYFDAWLKMVREKINKEGSIDRLGKFIILPAEGEFDNAQIQIKDNADFQVFSASSLANRYGLPWVGVRSGETNAGGHETLLLKVLKKEVVNNKPQLTLLVYDPMKGDQKEPIIRTIIKTGKPEEQGGKINWNDSTTWDYFDIIVTPQSLKMLVNGSYDLTIGSDPLMMSSEYVSRLKTSAYQTGEANNCVMWTFLLSMARWGAKYRSGDPNLPPQLKFLFEKGFDKFASDWKINDPFAGEVGIQFTTHDQIEKMTKK